MIAAVAGRAIASGTPIRDVLLPRSDRAAAVQVAVVVALTLLTVVLVRRERALVLLVIGVGMVLLGVMGLRTLH